jgi:hypothetical protein
MQRRQCTAGGRARVRHPSLEGAAREVGGVLALCHLPARGPADDPAALVDRGRPRKAQGQLRLGQGLADLPTCLLSALRRLRQPEAGKIFERNFRSLERLWEAVAPDPSLYPHRHQYNWLCGIYVGYRRRKRGGGATYGELSAKTRQLIEENTTFVREAEELPVFRIDADYATGVDQLPTPVDKAAALEAALTAELAETTGRALRTANSASGFSG